MLMVLAAVLTVVGSGMLAWGALGDSGAAAGLTFPTLPAASPSVTVDAAEVERKRRAEAERQARENNERRLTAALDKYAASKPEFALAVLDNRTGRMYSYEGTKRLEMASIVKVDILAALLLKAQDDGRTLTSRERELARAMITQSDNAAASDLYDTIGGTAGLNAAAKRLGLKKTVASPSWGLTRTTAEDQARLVSETADSRGPLKGESRRLIRDLMTSVVKDQRWGISAAAERSEKIAVKNGWLARDTENQLYIINSVGRITGPGVDVSMVVLSHRHKTMQGGINVVEQVATMAREHLDF